MILLTSIAALAMGTAPVQSPNPVQPPAGAQPAKVASAPAAASALSVEPVWKPKPKPWLAPDMAKPEDKRPIPKSRPLS